MLFHMQMLLPFQWPMVGEGTVDALPVFAMETHGSQLRGPLPNQRIHTYLGLIDGGKTAVIEMAKPMVFTL